MYTDFAWECLRRNREYISDWEDFFRNGDNKNMAMATPETLEKKWGLLRFQNPFHSSAENVFWSEPLSSRSIIIKLHDNGHVSASSLINRNKTLCRKFLAYNGCACIKVYNNHGYMQIFIDEDDLNNFTTDKYVYFSLNKRSAHNIHSLLSGNLPSANPCAGKMDSLYFYDKHSQGFTQKEIALYFYGERVTTMEWDSDSWLRARVRYKLKMAEKLIMHDYVNYI